MLITCPEQFRLRRIKKIPESFGQDKFIGAVDHQVHAYNFEQKIKTGQDLELDWMHGLYHARWDTELETDGEPEWETSPDTLKEQGLLMVDLYHENVSPTVTPLHVEERFEHHVKGAPVPVVGYTDVETPTSLIERKTTSTKLKSPKPGWRFQGEIYSMVYEKPVDYHLVTKQKVPQLCLPGEDNQLRITAANKDNVNRTIVQAIETLNDLWLRYGPDNPWPTIGTFHDWKCNYCGFGPRYGKQCVAWRDS